MPYILFLVLIGLVGCAPESIPVKEEVEPVLEQEIEDVPVEALYPDFDSFLSAIQLKNVSKLGSSEKLGFYYEIREGDLKPGVRKFNPLEYYSLFQAEETKLSLAIENLSHAYLVRGTREVGADELPIHLKKHNNLIDPSSTYFNEEKARLTNKLIKVTTTASSSSDSIKPVFNVDLKALAQNFSSKVKSDRAENIDPLNVGVADDSKDSIGRDVIIDELVQLIYINDLNGDYEIARLIEEKICDEFSVRCSESVGVPITGLVEDVQGNPVSGATIYVLNYPGITAITGDDGFYEIDYLGQSPQKVRMRAIASGYSDAFKDFYIVSDTKNQSRIRDFKLSKAHGVVRFNTEGRSVPSKPTLQASLVEQDILLDSVEGIATAQYKDDSLILTTNLTEYTIPLDGFVRSSGTKYQGKLSAYVYEFNKESNIEDLLRVDASDGEGNFFGSMLKTFGMPFIQFYDEAGAEVFIDRSNPMVIVSQIAEMDALKQGGDSVYDALTDEHIQQLLDYSNKSKAMYPITREYLIQNNLVMFPQWWVLDRLKGKWKAEPFVLLDMGGLVKTIFYSIDLGLSDVTEIINLSKNEQLVDALVEEVEAVFLEEGVGELFIELDLADLEEF